MIFSLLNHHNILINSETECTWPLQGTQGHIAASTTALYVTTIWIVQRKKASFGLIDVVWRNKMIKRKISSTWVKRFQCLTAVFTPACFVHVYGLQIIEYKWKFEKYDDLSEPVGVILFETIQKWCRKDDDKAVNMLLSHIFWCLAAIKVKMSSVFLIYIYLWMCRSKKNEFIFGSFTFICYLYFNQ